MQIFVVGSYVKPTGMLVIHSFPLLLFSALFNADNIVIMK